MLGDRWIYDRVPTDRFPDYTRGNAGEVLADPVSPLAWTFCWEPGPVQGCVDGFEQMGVFDRLEYGDPPSSFGLFGGYFYNSLTQRYGFEEAAAKIQELYLSGMKGEAAMTVPDELVDEIALVGPKERIAERLEAWREAGITTLVVQTRQAEALQVMAELVL